MWRLQISVRNKTVMTRALKTTIWSAKLPKNCGEYLLKTCVCFHPICMITVPVCDLKLQHVRSSLPQVKRRGSQDALTGNTDSTSTSSIGRATLLHSEQLYGKISFVSYQFRETPKRDASTAQLYKYVLVCGVRLVSVRRASVP